MTHLDTQPLAEFVNERHAMYLRKELQAGADPSSLHVPPGVDLSPFMSGPITQDPVLAEYRFCNVFRELDRVTQWIERNIRKPFAGHPHLWFMLAAARYINWPPTLQYLMNRGEEKCGFDAWPGEDSLPNFEFTPEEMGNALDYWAARGEKVYTGAYMIRAESNHNMPWYSWSKHQYIAQIVLGRLWETREEWAELLSEPRPSLQRVWQKFQDRRFIGWGPFMAYQVVVDLRHTDVLRDAWDINSWCALGPGSRRGLNRLAGLPAKTSLTQERGLFQMLDLWESQDDWRAPWVPPIDLSDIQNCLCEVDKLLRVRTGEGVPRARYQTETRF